MTSEPSLITVDIATRSVADEEDIYVVRPGAGYALYSEFDRTERVFLDFPGLGLPLNKEPSPDQMRLMIARALAVRDWHLAERNGAQPSRDLKDYSAHGRRFGRYQGAIHKLYFELPPGTIIVVPGPGFFSDVLIGVLQGPAELAHDITTYPGESIPVRRVRWMGRRPRAEFSSELRDLLGNSHPVMALNRSLRGEILEAGFDRYIYKGQFTARFETTKSEFNTLDDYDIQSFVNYVAGILAVRESGAERASLVSIAEAFQVLRSHPEMVPELTSNINSPGFLRMISDRVSPLVIAVLFSVAIASPGPAMAHDAMPKIEVTNSVAAPHDPCAVHVAQEASGAMSLMLYDEWKAACEHARDAHRSTGVKTNMKVSTAHAHGVHP